MRAELGAGGCRAANAGCGTLSLRDRRARSGDRRTLGTATIDRAAAQERLDLVAAQSLIFEQRLGKRLELLAMLLEQALGAVIALLDDAADFLVDRLRGLVRHVLLPIDRIAEEHLFVGLRILQRAERIRHAPPGDHVAGETGRIADVGRGA